MMGLMAAGWGWGGGGEHPGRAGTRVLEEKSCIPHPPERFLRAALSPGMSSGQSGLCLPQEGKRMATWNSNLMADINTYFGGTKSLGESIPSSLLVKYQASPPESPEAFLGEQGPGDTTLCLEPTASGALGGRGRLGQSQDPAGLRRGRARGSGAPAEAHKNRLEAPAHPQVRLA